MCGTIRGMSSRPFTIRVPGLEIEEFDRAFGRVSGVKVCRGCGAFAGEPCRGGSHPRRVSTSVLVRVTLGGQPSRTSLLREVMRGLVESGCVEDLVLEAARGDRLLHELIAERLSR